jgi:hypothetical protein
LPVRGELNPIKRLVYFRARDHRGARNVHDDDLVLAVTAMQHRGKAPRRMDRNVDGKIAEFDLPSHRA